MWSYLSNPIWIKTSMSKMRKQIMSLENDIKDVLFKIGQEVIIHKIDSDNTILEIDYDKFTVEIMELFKNYLQGTKI